MPEAVPARGRVRSFESMWTRKYGFPFPLTMIKMLLPEGGNKSLFLQVFDQCITVISGGAQGPEPNPPNFAIYA